uniref:Uncharacterized protein n=1 Tax=Janibacter limosus TaxID=53458 RepID=A0AC61U370_9MICO|nr:hypothetical protein [Janibacter limosus]
MAVVGRRWQAVAMPLPRDAASVFDRKNTPLMRLIDVTDPRSLEGSSPCEGWSGLDVVQHLIDTQRDFLLKAGADLPDPAPTVAALGPATAWRTHAEAVARQLADDTPAERCLRDALRDVDGGGGLRPVLRLRPDRAPVGHRPGRGRPGGLLRARARAGRDGDRRLRRAHPWGGSVRTGRRGGHRRLPPGPGARAHRPRPPLTRPACGKDAHLLKVVRQGCASP